MLQLADSLDRDAPVMPEVVEDRQKADGVTLWTGDFAARDAALGACVPLTAGGRYPSLQSWVVVSLPGDSTRVLCALAWWCPNGPGLAVHRPVRRRNHPVLLRRLPAVA